MIRFFSLLVLLLSSQSAHAWSNHELLMKQMEPTLLAGLKGYISAVDFSDLAKGAEEPDGGMDQNLPDSADPLNERPWMGGKTGLGSQGFRHMYFGGWNWHYPITTLQYPLRPIGQAPNRVQETAVEAQKYFREGNRAEGLRHLGWALHYLQDLAQPYHAVQIPNRKFLAIKFSFGDLVEETTRRVANHHLALEDYLLYRLQTEPQLFRHCFEGGNTFRDHLQNEPKDLALQVAETSVALAKGISKTEIRFFGELLDHPAIDLRIPRGEPDYAKLAADGGRIDYRKAFEDQICKAVGNATVASLQLIQGVLNVRQK